MLSGCGGACEAELPGLAIEGDMGPRWLLLAWFGADIESRGSAFLPRVFLPLGFPLRRRCAPSWPSLSCWANEVSEGRWGEGRVPVVSVGGSILLRLGGILKGWLRRACV